MATLKEITHDSSLVLSDFYGTINDPDGAITVAAAAALGGSTNGLSIDNDAGAANPDLADSFSSSTPSGARFRARVNLDGLTNASSSDLIIAIATEGSGSTRLQMEISGNGSTGFTIRAYYDADGAGPLIQIGSGFAMPSGDTCLEMRALRETADGNNDGEVEFFINQISQGSDLAAENFNSFDFDNMALYIESPAAISGTYKYDEFILTDIAGTSVCAGGLTLAAMTKPADVDAAGEFIYVALLEGGTPILTKISAALDADGTTVFDPGAGDNIGVECGRFDSDVVWVAGNFDGTNVVEKSEDGGSTFTVKDNGAIGDVRAFVMGPDSDDKILVFDETNGDILESRDNGGSWTTINASVTPEINAIARLGTNVQESVFGNDGGANNSINYSVNSGDDLEDFQTGVYPNANATKIIVN